MEEERRAVHRCGGGVQFSEALPEIPARGNWINNHADKQTTPTSTRLGWSRCTSWEALGRKW